MDIYSRDFQVFVKPVSGNCNLKCSYCYYSGVNNPKKGDEMNHMPIKILEKYIIQHIEATCSNVVMFTWHGGEPLLAGIDFYKKALEIQKKYLPPGKVLLNGIQTNGTLLNDKWCSFMKSENFLVGISIDGPKEFQNHFRLKKNGNGTFDEVYRGYSLLQKHEITTEILCVVNIFNQQFPDEIYGFFRSLGAKYITFLPLVEHVPGAKKGVSDYSVGPESFGDFLITIFEEWVKNDIGRIKIQVFEEALRSAFDDEHTLCIFKKNCGRVPVVESNGDFYSCDHFVNNRHFVGNILETKVSDLLESNKQRMFGWNKSFLLPLYCKNCEVLSMCNGECPKNRFGRTPEGEPGLNYLCAGYRKFFNHCMPYVKAIRDVKDRELT